MRSTQETVFRSSIIGKPPNRMSLTHNAKTALAAIGAMAILLVGLLAVSPQARADSVVFMTRMGRVISTYPNNDALSIGTSTAATQVATSTVPKLGVTLNPSDNFLGLLADGYQSAFGIASTTTKGGTATSTANLFSVRNTGCIQLTSTSSATQIKLVLSITGATSTFNGTAYWQYGTCP